MKTYEVKTKQDAVTVEGPGPVKIQFEVTNPTDLDRMTTVQVHVEGAVKKEWCKVVPATDTVVGARKQVVYDLTLSPSGVAQAASGALCVEAAWVDEPNTFFTKSPEVRVTLLPAPPPPPSWLRRYWWVLALAGLALVLTVVLLFVLLGTKDVQIRRFEARPASGVPGTQVELVWTVAGPVTDVFLELPGLTERVPIEAERRHEGTFSVQLPAQPGQHVCRLLAVDAPGEENEQTMKLSELQLRVEDPPIDAKPPRIEAFTATPTTVESGKEVTFAWKLAGDIGKANLVFQDESFLPIEVQEHAAGSRKRAFLPGRQPVKLIAFSADLRTSVEQELTIEVKAPPQALVIEEFRLIGQNGKTASLRVPGKPPQTVTFYDPIQVHWKVAGPVKTVKLVLGGREFPLSGAAGERSIPGRLARGVVGQLVVTGAGPGPLSVSSEVAPANAAIRFRLDQATKDVMTRGRAIPILPVNR